MKTTKTIIALCFLTASISVVRAQDAAGAMDQALDSQIPATVYEAPVIYAASVIYQAPVIYNAPVYYVAPASCPPAPVCATPTCATPSTVVYIGGGQVGYQNSYCNSGSTVTYIGGQSRFH